MQVPSIPSEYFSSFRKSQNSVGISWICTCSVALDAQRRFTAIHIDSAGSTLLHIPLATKTPLTPFLYVTQTGTWRRSMAPKSHVTHLPIRTRIVEALPAKSRPLFTHMGGTETVKPILSVAGPKGV